MIFSGRIEIVELSGHISATTQSKAEHKPANRNIRVPAASNVYPQCVSTWRVGVTSNLQLDLVKSSHSIWQAISWFLPASLAQKFLMQKV